MVEMRGAGFRYNPGPERSYGLRVPVVEVDGREEFEFRVEPQRLRALLGDPRNGRRR